MNTGTGNRSLVPPLLRDRVFRRYWGASTVSMFGDQVSSVAVPLTAVIVLRAGPAAMGYLTALLWLPSLLFGLHAGAWVDRRGRRRHMMILADVGRAAALATIPVCNALHALTLLQVYAVTFVVGTLCSPCATGRCSCRSCRPGGTWTGRRSSTAAGRCRSSAGRPSAACSSRC
ncbi:MFS transporter [Trebonia sp.]|uniref:MFS transporter n=1 Tax=Trebonia sp. TaxID=2767075 RepID=UPI00261F0FBC|nr:MFS transporter [Trebonia sp.]